MPVNIKNRTKLDALFVINQNVRLDKIGTIAREKGFSGICILSTHHLFKNERLKAESLGPSVLIITFADLLNDSEMQSCDDRATEELANLIINNDRKKDINLFIDKSLKNKNEIIYQKLQHNFLIEKIYFTGGLGIHYDFWHSVGAISLENRFRRYLIHKLHVLYRKFSNITKRKNICRIVHNKECFLFFSEIKRLGFSSDIKIDKISFNRVHWILFCLFSNKGKRFITASIKRLVPSRCRPIISTTVHDYVYQLSTLGLKLYVFVDGFHPSNYPKSYIDMYINCEFISPNMFCEPWFDKYGKTVHKALSFMASSEMKMVKPHKNNPIRTILLVLNHAGDWSALINRSDTDLLIECFADIAQQLSEYNFIVRPHPTMIMPEHEGTGSLKRIKRYINWRGLKNLSISSKSLNEDIKRGDIFVSEYSQVLIDVLHAGKLGIIANLTNRRSFMEDYEKTGFIAVNGPVTLKEKILESCKNPFKVCRQQNQAAKRYNEMLSENGYCITD